MLGVTGIASTSTHAKTADNMGELIEAFTLIGTTIRSMAKAWEVTDPMGATIIYGGATDQSSGYTDFDFDKNILTWQIHKMAVGEVDGIYTYT